ncbi:MAG: hypothetical protein KAS04_01405 [Candidatus Aenigmarchaeota archaeon]|nr:hypothetical protein [Candidatus Aenigmarchaeota archaeon]
MNLKIVYCKHVLSLPEIRGIMSTIDSGVFYTTKELGKMQAEARKKFNRPIEYTNKEIDKFKAEVND